MKSIRIFLLCFILLITISSGALPSFLNLEKAQAATTAIPLTVRETADIARENEIITSGIPLPKDLNLQTTNDLAISDPMGKKIPAQFRVLARWNAGKDDMTAPIQWLLVSFPAHVGALSEQTYHLVTDGSLGSNPAPDTPLHLQQTGNEFTVHTGVAEFKFNKNTGALFDQILNQDGIAVATAGPMSVRIGGENGMHSQIRSVRVEDTGPLTATIVIEGTYTLTPGGKPLSSMRRYTFTAGSATARIRQAVNWEGDLGCQQKLCAGKPNAVLIDLIRNSLKLSFASPLSVLVSGDLEAVPSSGVINGAESAKLEQMLRLDRKAPLHFEIDLAGQKTEGQKSDGGILAASNGSAGLSIALKQMHRYEPQALRIQNGEAMIDLASNTFWLAHHQGMFATMAISALAAAPNDTMLKREIWAPLNAPLEAWLTPSWFRNSGAVEEFPTGELPTEFKAYDEIMAEIMIRTLQKIDSVGLPGIMTFGVYPRNWGEYDNYDGEVDCKDGDATPDKSWDQLFWCSTWTDYHNALSLVPIWAMRSGKVELLHELATPGALRTLHTQIMQCSPEDTWFYCGQAPAGYGGYRDDFNSSHQYFENLALYYWRTGDSTVLTPLLRGGKSARKYLCSDQVGACPNRETGVLGRNPMQWTAVFRFLGLAADQSFLTDYRNMLTHWVNQHYAELEKDGIAYGFLGSSTPADPQSATTPNIYGNSIYDLGMIYRYLRDTGDAALGNAAVRPSRVITAWARTLRDIVPKLSGDGTIEGKWPSRFSYRWSGNRIGGKLEEVKSIVADGSPEFLYPHGKVNAAFPLLVGAALSGDQKLLDFGKEVLRWSLPKIPRQPLNKETGIYLFRFHSGIAQLAKSATDATFPGTPSTPPPVASSFQLRDDEGNIRLIAIIQMMRFISTPQALNPDVLRQADLNQDGKLNLIDVILALRAHSGS